MNSRLIFVIAVFAIVLKIRADDACGGLSYYGPQGYGWNDKIELGTSDGDYRMYFYYPARTNGSGADFDPSGAPYPVISFAHGFASPDMEYLSYFEHFSSWGYFAVAPNSRNAYQGQMDEYTQDIHQVIEWLKTQNSDPSSWLYQQVDVNSIAIVGHSMGAVATTLSSFQPYIDPGLRAIVPIAGSAEKQDLIHNITVPTLLITGTADKLMPPATTNFAFANMQIPKIHSQIIGGWHCGFMDLSVLLPDERCQPEGDYMDRSTQLMLTRCLMMPFLHLYLKNLDYSDLVWGPGVFGYDMVNVTTHPWLRIEPQQLHKQAALGSNIVFHTRLTNSGLASSSFSIRVAESSSSITVAPTRTAVLAPGESALVTIILTLESLGGDSATLYAVWDLDGVTQQYFQISASPV